MTLTSPAPVSRGTMGTTTLATVAGSRWRQPRWMQPRWVHPGAWWIWALGLAVAASRTTNPLLLGLIVAIAAFVVVHRRPRAPWGRTFGAFLILGAFIIGIRIVFQVLLGVPVGTTVLFTLPTLDLPSSFAGISIGGQVTGEEVLAGAYEGLRLATILACVGAANSLASPARLLASLPGALYEAGVAVVIAVTFAPQLIVDLQRVRAARRLRGRPVRGLRGLAGSAIPVLEGALERSVHLAAAMDSRGYGRIAGRSAAQRKRAAWALFGALSTGLVGTYAMLDAAAPSIVGAALMIVALVLAIVGVRVAGARSPRTRYRPDPWRAPEWITATSGVVAAATFIVLGLVDGSGMSTSVDPAQWPELPAMATLALLAALIPAWLTPIPPDRAPLDSPDLHAMGGLR